MFSEPFSPVIYFLRAVPYMEYKFQALAMTSDSSQVEGLIFKLFPLLLFHKKYFIYNDKLCFNKFCISVTRQQPYTYIMLLFHYSSMIHKSQKVQQKYSWAMKIILKVILKNDSTVYWIKITVWTTQFCIFAILYFICSLLHCLSMCTYWFIKIKKNSDFWNIFSFFFTSWHELLHPLD